MAHITVRFVSDLVTAVRDRAGNVVEGDIKATRQVTDVWTFARDVTSPNPNWRLVATDSPEG
jgi:predicted lipid-binding transport protein (Tim44 family)